MTGRLTRLVALMSLAAIALFAGASLAHETRPGYLELRESDHVTYALLWKRPTGGETEIQIAPVVPDGCRLLTPDQQQLTPGAVVVRGTLRCQGGLRERVRKTGVLLSPDVDPYQMMV